jgi:RNA polymerase sigma-54 factor
MSQQLSLTPQLRQAIRLLQLSSVELEIEVREALEANPLLDREDESADPASGNESPEGDGESGSTETALDGADGESAPERKEREESADGADDWEEARTLDDTWEPSRGNRNNTDAEGDTLEARTAAPESLHDYLMWQLNLTPVTDHDRQIAEALIDAVEDDGYLREEASAIRSALGAGFDTDEDEIEAVRHRLQRFDPPGVASRNLRECLLVQLSQADPETPHLELARTIADQHLEALAKDPPRLAARLGVTAEDLDGAATVLRGLNPRPGNAVGELSTEYVVPDAYAFKYDGRWRVRLNGACQPSLAINRHYEQMAAASRGEAASYLKGRLQEARWLIRSLAARGETLTKVATCIVRQQSAFLDYGPEAMRPLTLREVADEIGVHESTVSRITTRKYLHTPRGTFEFKHFFSVGLATPEGGEASATAIRAMIRKLVDDEDPRKPLSDSAIAERLKERGIAVARRTVAKYREAMNIPASSDRCRLG